MSELTYGSRSIRRDRRTKADIEHLCDQLVEVVESDPPMTVRQVFYQMVGRGAVAKTEEEYKRTVVRLLTELRREGKIDYGDIADSTRWMRKPTTHTGLRAMLEGQKGLYRRALWEDQAAYVEVWLEKEALAGVLTPVTEEWDVPLMVTRGYASESFLYSAADAITDQVAKHKTAYVYYFGDHDPSGVNIPQVVERRLREMGADMFENNGRRLMSEWFRFERIAVTESQIVHWNLPTRPTKQTDVRAKSFAGESVEVDAIPPVMLRDLVRECIERHVDRDALERTQAVEALERETLAGIVEALPEVGS